MNKNKFVHLHTHSDHSTLDSINKVEEIPNRAKDLNQNAIACTDHGTLSGHFKFYNACVDANIKPILGLEAYYTINDRTVKEKDADEKAHYHLLLLAMNDVGYKNLIKVSSKAFTDGFYGKPRCDDALLAEYNEGLIATSTCLGSRACQLIMKHRKPEAQKLLEHHAAMFKDRFFLETQPHTNEEQSLVNKTLLELSKEYGWPLVHTADCHYMEEDDKHLHELTLCMQTNKTISDPNRMTFGDIDVSISSHDYMWKSAQVHGLPYECISNTVYVANMIKEYTHFTDTKNRFPSYKNLPKGLSSWQALERLSKHMLSEIFNGNTPPPEYISRLEEELKTIKKMGFSDYMLITWDFIELAKKNDCWVGPGRGSAGGSLVAYALGITRVDPIKHNLIFARFLSEGRSATPLHFTEEMRHTLENI